MNAFRITKNLSGLTTIGIGAVALSLLAGCQNEVEENEQSSLDMAGEALSAGQLRDFISVQVGGLAKLKVPGDDASLPLPAEDPSRPGRYKTTEAKRFLGKLLFHDPVRTARINVNK